MSNYSKATNFTAKDSLPTGNANKIVKGAEIDNEFIAIASAIASKADINSPTFTGVPAAPTATAGSNTTQLANTAFVKAAFDTLGTMSTQNASAVAITGGTISGLSTPLPVASGGTSSATLAANNVLLGNGTSALQAVAPSTTGNVLTSNGTTWTSAAPRAGAFGQVFTSSGTFTIPVGVTALKITVVGGGGAAGFVSGCNWAFGGSGGTTSVSSGTQSITTITATGGGGGYDFNSPGAPGSGSGGTLNTSGSIAAGTAPGVSGSGFGNRGAGGAEPISPPTASGGAGGAGGFSVAYINNVTPGATIIVNSIGAGSSTGVAGVVVFEW